MNPRLPTIGLLFAWLMAACGQSTATPAPTVLPTAPHASPSVIATDQVSTTPPAASAVPRLADPIRRISLPGTAPAAMAIAQEGVWVYSIESGDVTLVDPSSGTRGTTIHVGGFGSHIVLGSDQRLYVARFETGGSGSYLLAIDPRTGAVRDGSTGVLGALAVDDAGFLYALEKADRLVRVDPVTLAPTGSVAIAIDDEHMEVLVDQGVAWVSSDHTPLRRVTVPSLIVTDELDIGGGVPFVARDGLIWGARPGTLWALDPATKVVAREIGLAGVIEVLALDVDPAAGEAWLAVRMTGRVGAVLRLDLATERVVGTYPVSLPAAVRVVGPDTYVASYLDNELLVFRRS